MKRSVIQEKSYAFAIRIVKLYKLLTTDRKEFVLSKQCLRSGTAVGALVAEGVYGQSNADFLSKMNIALKEANETLYWVELLKDTGYISEMEFDSIHPDITELVKLLTSIVKTTRIKIGK